MTELGQKAKDFQRGIADAAPTLSELEQQRRAAVDALEAQHTALSGALREAEELERAHTAAVHPLLKAGAHRDARDAFLPKARDAAADANDDAAADLAHSLAAARARRV